jgi:hypothetical protein
MTPDQQEEVKNAFLDMLNQACGEWERKDGGIAEFKGYDSMCLSSYEGAIDLALELGWIKKEEVLR